MWENHLVRVRKVPRKRGALRDKTAVEKTMSIKGGRLKRVDIGHVPDVSVPDSDLRIEAAV